MTPTNVSLADRLPPQNIEAEQAVLGSLLINKDAIVQIADLISPDDFYHDAHRLIFTAMLDLYAARSPIDILNLTNRLEEKKLLEAIGGRSYLMGLANVVPTASNVVHYANIVQKKATLRRLIQTAQEIVTLGFRETEDVDLTLDQAEQSLFKVSQQYLRQNFIPLKNILTETFDRIDELHRTSGKLRGIPTGFSDLDQKLAGLQKSDLIIIAARPSIGKTSLVLDIARQVATRANVPVGIFSLEMSKEQLVDRMLCAEANISLWKMRTGRLSDREEDDDFPRIGHAMGILSEAPIFIDESATANVMEIRTKARRLQTEEGLGLLIIDYLQLMEGRRWTDNRVQEITEITRSLKAIARELNIPVIVLSQLNRAVEMRSPAIPKLADLRESGCLAGDTLLTRADTGQRIRIKDLIGQKNIPILSVDGDWKLVSKKISKIFPSGRKQIFQIRTRGGRTIKASANHPFLTIEGWKRLDQLTPGAHVGIPRSITIQNNSCDLSDSEIILLAHLLGDGCILPQQPFHYTSADPENIRIVSKAAFEVFGIKTRLVRQKNWFHVYLPSPYRLARGQCHPITNWFHKLKISPVHSYEKRIPDILFTGSQSQIQLFLHHLWATDGNISWKILPFRKKSSAIYYSTTSQVLAEQVQHILLRLGIISSLRTVRQKHYRMNYQVHIQGREQATRFYETVGSFGSRGNIIPHLLHTLQEIKSNPNLDVIPKTAWRTFVEPAKIARGYSWRDVATLLPISYCGSSLLKNGISRERRGRFVQILESQTLTSLATSNIFWDEIRCITPLGIEEVFDATVPDTHNFVANDFIVHNSIEQDADVVLFIYRETMDKTIKNPRDGRRGICEIHIAKHRNGPTGTIELYFDEERVSFKNLEKQLEPESQAEPF